MLRGNTNSEEQIISYLDFDTSDWSIIFEILSKNKELNSLKIFLEYQANEYQDSC